METLTATTIFWLIALGSFTGWISGYIMGKEGISLSANIIWGIGGSLSVGLIALLLQLSGALLFAFMGTLGTLFIANAFHIHHKEDLGDKNEGMTVQHRFPKIDLRKRSARSEKESGIGLNK